MWYKKKIFAKIHIPPTIFEVETQFFSIDKQLSYKGLDFEFSSLITPKKSKIFQIV